MRALGLVSPLFQRGRTARRGEAGWSSTWLSTACQSIHLMWPPACLAVKGISQSLFLRHFLLSLALPEQASCIYFAKMSFFEPEPETPALRSSYEGATYAHNRQLYCVCGLLMKSCGVTLPTENNGKTCWWYPSDFSFNMWREIKKANFLKFFNR